MENLCITSHLYLIFQFALMNNVELKVASAGGSRSSFCHQRITPRSDSVIGLHCRRRECWVEEAQVCDVILNNLMTSRPIVFRLLFPAYLA